MKPTPDWSVLNVLSVALPVVIIGLLCLAAARGENAVVCTLGAAMWASTATLRYCTVTR